MSYVDKVFALPPLSRSSQKLHTILLPLMRIVTCSGVNSHCTTPKHLEVEKKHGSVPQNYAPYPLRTKIAESDSTFHTTVQKFTCTIQNYQATTKHAMLILMPASSCPSLSGYKVDFRKMSASLSKIDHALETENVTAL